MGFFYIIAPIVYVIVGAMKLKFFDRNNEAGWLMLLSDDRSRRCGAVWVYIMLLVAWFTWPIAIFSKELSLVGCFFRFQWNHLK
jgi:hypothetical protein